MAALEVANAGTISPLFRALPISEARAERVLEMCGLAPMLLEDQRGLIALHAGERFLCELPKAADAPTFNFDVMLKPGANPAGHVANIPLPFALTGLDAARTFTSRLDGAITGLRFYCHLRGDTLWLLRSTGATVWSDRWPVIFYTYAVMLEGMRRLYRPDIRPVAAVAAEPTPPPELPEMLADLPLELGAPRVGLGFPIAALARPGPAPRAPRALNVEYHRLSQTGADAVAACILQFLQSARTDHLAERTAASFGMSVRSYQRHLTRLGTTHSRLVDDARLTAAFEMLKDLSLPVTSIALELGYSYPGDFTRFFKSRVGVTPTEYRRV